jgi:flagellin
MALNSINTNVGALVALQNLNQTNRDLSVTQNRINTGMKVSSAKDNGAIWAVAQNQRADMGALDAVKNSISRGQSVADVGLAAGESIMDALREMKNLAIAIEAGAAASEDVTAYSNDFAALNDEIEKMVDNAKFDGVSAFTAASGAVRVGLASDATATLGVSLTVTAAQAAGSTVSEVQTAIDNVTAALQTLGTQSKSLDRSMTFTSKLQDVLETGIGNLVDADLAKESARLQALQTKQQLGVQALSIANQAPSMLMGLFR